MAAVPPVLKQVSMYAINKISQDAAYEEDLDTSEVSDATLSDFVQKVYEKGSASLEDMREVIFLPGSYVKGRISEIMVSDNFANFKEKSLEIAEKLFNVTQLNYKKGDLLSALFIAPSAYIVVICKIDENQYIKRGPNNKWLSDVGLNKEIKLQKAAYIRIPLDCVVDPNKWVITTIDKISSDAQYWNNRFLEATFKRDNRTNTKGFDDFFTGYVKELKSPEEQFRVKAQYLHYVYNNKQFDVAKFLDSVYGDSDQNMPQREALANAIESAANARMFDMTFSFDKGSLKRKAGKFVIDDKIKIEYTKSIDSVEDANEILTKKVRIHDDEGYEFTDSDGRKYAKVYYNDIEYKQ